MTAAAEYHDVKCRGALGTFGSVSTHLPRRHRIARLLWAVQQPRQDTQTKTTATSSAKHAVKRSTNV